MATSQTVKGYFSPSGGKPVIAQVKLTLDGYGLNETITLHCHGAYQVTLPFRPIEQLASDARRALFPQSAGTVEPSITLEGYDNTLRTGRVTVWLRSNGQFEMLTIELERKGQISLPYTALESLARAERRFQA